MMIKRYKPHNFQKQFHNSKVRFRTLIAGRRGGKSQPITEPVLTPNGYVSMGSLKVGDIVCTPTGTADIKHIYPQGVEDVYLLTFSDGAQTRASGDHLWKVRFTNAHNKGGIYTTLELLDIFNQEESKGRMSKNIQIDTPKPIQFKTKELPIDPYIMGIILGDGGITQDTVTFTSTDNETIDYIKRFYEVKKMSGDYSYRIISGININKSNGRFEGKKGSIKTHLKGFGLMGRSSHTKFIPEVYLHGDMEQRILLLQGLMDSDGYIDIRGHATYYSVNNKLAQQVQWLVRSLGGTATLFDKTTTYKGGDVASYAVYIQFSGDINPAMISRKANRWKQLGIGILRRRITNIQYVGREKCQCINIGGDGLYITNDFIITHNSIAGTIEALRWADMKAQELGRPTKGMIIAPTYPMLQDVNVPMFMDWCPTHTIKAWNKQDKKVQLINGSEITFRSGDNPDRLRGVGLDWVWMDEASFMDREVWEVVYPALTDKGGYAWITTTPQGYDWVYEGFYKPAVDKQEDYEAWRYATEDNPYIDKVLIEKAKQDLSDVMFRQEYLASFEKFEGLIYPDFEEEIHVKEAPPRVVTDIFFVSLDVGWNHPTAILLAKEDVNHNLYIVDEVREQYLDTKGISKQLSGLLMRNGIERHEISAYIIDPASKGTQQTSGMSMYDQLIEEGWAFVPGNNDVMAGINRVTRLLRERKLFVSKRCDKVREEIRSYHWRKWKENSDADRAKPFKLGEDLMDALRYLIMSRPDWFEHPTLDSYGRVIDDTEDIAYQDPEEEDVIDIMDSGGDLIEDGGSYY